MNNFASNILEDTGERIIPPKKGELSVVFEHHKYAYEETLPYVKDKIILDVGCGTGYGVNICSEYAKFVVGLDYDLSAIKYCNENFVIENNSFLNSNALLLSIRDNSIDLAITFQVIEHIADAVKFINELRRVVKPSGLIIISTPNVTGPEKGKGKNRFHINEMNYSSLTNLLTKSFDSFEIFGHTYKSQSSLMRLIRKMPLYTIGARFRRSSVIKKQVSKSLGMTKFKTVKNNVENSMDLYAVCKNT